jgi:3-dehydroquinate synthase
VPLSDDDLVVRSLFGEYAAHFCDAGPLPEQLPAAAQALYVVDERVWQLHRDHCLRGLDDRQDEVVLLPISEERKTLATAEELYAAITQRQAKRDTTLVSIGGGITQDITGFVASTLYRGVTWIYAPTTLLAQADSCIGSKTSLNWGRFKNLIGTMYPPRRVYVHGGFLQTLSEADHFSGLGEVVKLHLVGGAETAAVLEAELPALLARDRTAVARAVRRSLLIKRDFIQEDELDSGRRRVLNFGHCFGHAVESAGDFSVPHGQAVLAGMILAGLVARARGVLSVTLEGQLRERLLRPLLTVLPDQRSLDPQGVVAAMRQDKKRTGPKLALVMLCDDYRLELAQDLEEAEAVAALGEMRGLL